MLRPTRTPAWVTTTEMCEHLGISVNHLYRLRDAGVFKENRHWKDVRKRYARRATYKWHLKRCEKTLDMPVQERQ